ncbi:uncharacterized protein JCM6883_003031 [Sporobolomyces salmoneus]|uniref:uncharacterized protein n=1 Tax=Sporobolomyces salmoneus TaxID=183962 RepID=UPI003180E8ED
MASPSGLIPSPSPPPSLRLRSSSQQPRVDPTKYSFSVDENGQSHLVTPPSSREDPTEFFESKQSSARASRSLHTSTDLLSKEELLTLSGKGGFERVFKHAVALDSLRQLERTEYLEQLEQAKSKIAKLETELAILHASSPQVDLARLQSENNQLTSQSIALARKLQNASVSVKADTEQAANEGGEGLKKENRKLKVDVRHLERRLEASENETSRLTSELRRLRPYYLTGVPLIVHDAHIVLPPESAVKPGSRAVLLGDAEAELLLQAGKILSHVRRIQRIPLDKAIQEQAEEIVQAIVPLPVDPPRPPKALPLPNASLVDQDTSQTFQLPVPPSLRGHQPNSGQSTNYDNSTSPAIGTNLDLASSLPFDFQATDELPIPPPLAASQSTLSTSSSNVPGQNGLVGKFAANRPVQGDMVENREASTEFEKNPPPPIASALCGLPTVGPAPVAAPPSRPQRNAVPSASTPTAPQGSKFDEIEMNMIGGGASGSGGKPVGRTPSALDLLSEAAGAMGTGNDAEPYNPRSRKPKLDANGEKKARSPYIKWNVQEDEQLLRAVIECGCAWDSVAKLCPTRAYHQVRQRFLRGLRSGETLPPELMHLQSAVRRSVADYEARKKRKRPARQLSASIRDSQTSYGGQQEQMESDNGDGDGDGSPMEED